MDLDSVCSLVLKYLLVKTIHCIIWLLSPSLGVNHLSLSLALSRTHKHININKRGQSGAHVGAHRGTLTTTT